MAFPDGLLVSVHI